MGLWRALLRWFYSDFGSREADQLASLPFNERSDRITELIRGSVPDPRQLALQRWREVSAACEKLASIPETFEIQRTEALADQIRLTKEVLIELSARLEQEPFEAECLAEVHRELDLLELEIGIGQPVEWLRPKAPSSFVRRISTSAIESDLKNLESLNNRAREAFVDLTDCRSTLDSAMENGASDTELAKLKAKAEVAVRLFLELAEEAYLLDRELDLKAFVNSAQTSASDYLRYLEAVTAEARQLVAVVRKTQKELRTSSQGVDPQRETGSASSHEPPNSAV
ncbi:hypothetical protein [Fimbriimonas ginsengisoli]|uniref:Uncharacterized protein n=1 Tax=Fimbriimonas ginsengisoli Gsoil 348 TaxID=661478 RepID=A0A068NXQ5_FIMGI|nr:hypothetical protein [Fimbriimonas ginsengisoli]AIE86424.1 hypothetical protein OP10G_3056 [Fimbriimonas ginsengisoli Gsoil 348]